MGDNTINTNADSPLNVEELIDLAKMLGFRPKKDNETKEMYNLALCGDISEKADLFYALDILPYGAGKNIKFVKDVILLRSDNFDNDCKTVDGKLTLEYLSGRKKHPIYGNFMKVVEKAAELNGQKDLLNLVRETYKANK